MPILKWIYIYIYLFFSFVLSLYYNRHGLIILVPFQHCVPSMSVKRFSGFNVKTVLSGANCQPMHFFHQSGPVLKTHGTQKGRPSSISISETWAFHSIYFIQDEFALLKWRIYFIHVIGWLLHDAHVGMKLYLMEFRLSLLAKLLEHLLIHKHRKELDLSCHSRGFFV